MPSGNHLTVEQKDRILKLVGMQHPDGDWVYTYREVADRMGIHQVTVSAWVRTAAVKWGKLTAWKAEQS